MNFDVQVVHSVEEVGQEAWDFLGRNRPFASFRWYRFGERAMAYARPVYVIVSLQGEPVARATYWLTHREVMPMSSRVMCYLVEALLRSRPLLMCQAPLTDSTASPGLILPAPPLRDAALQTIGKVAIELGRQYHASFCIFSYLEEDETHWPGWPSVYVPATTPGPGTRLDIVWPNFEAYLAHLNKKQRYNVRRNYRLAAQSGIEVKAYPKATNIDLAMRLHRNVTRRHRSRPEPWVRGALEHADLVDTIWLAAEVDGQLVGCELMLGDRDTWLVTALGLDYGVSYAYFVLGYADIRHAIERGARVLRWGSLTYEVKERLGFQKESNNHDMFVGLGWFHRLGKWIATSWT